MVLGKLPVPGRPTILITVGQGPIALAVGAGGVVWTFLLLSILSPLSPSLWETARYRLKYCLKGPLNPKQPTNQPATLQVVYGVRITYQVVVYCVPTSLQVVVYSVQITLRVAVHGVPTILQVLVYGGSTT